MAELTRWFSWACRSCLAGWWGPIAPKTCPNCGGTVHITGNGYGLSITQQPEETDDV